MDAPNYTYNGQLWAPSLTVADKNSFFHSAFGVKNDENEAYFDRQAKFRRMRWATFLTYFENETLPLPLANILKKCLSATLKYKKVSIENSNQLNSYIYDIIYGERGVDIEEIPVIATLENIKIVLFVDGASSPIIIEPNIEILGSFLNVSENRKEVVLSLNKDVFQKLQKSENYYSRQLSSPSNKYFKTGCAGTKGIEFQVNLLAVCMLNAVRNKLDDWRLSTENERAGKFDDAVLEWSEGAVLLQAKHSESQRKMEITLEDLMSTNPKNYYSLPKYFLSYQEVKNNFIIKNLIICTNASFKNKVLKLVKRHTVDPKCMLYYESNDCGYTLNEEIMPLLKINVISYLKNIKSKHLDETIVTDENLRDFLDHLHLYVDFPSGKELEDIIKQILSKMNLDRPTSSSDIYIKVMHWYKQKKGVYLTDLQVKAMFLEIWRDKYLDTLKEYKVYFQDMEPIFQQLDRVVQIVTEDGHFLQELKLCRSLEDKSEILYLKSDDSVCVQRQVIESFWLPQYVSLIVFWPKFSGDFANRACEELKKILDQHSYKKLVFVTDSENKSISDIYDHYSVVKRSVVFGDLSKDTREALLKKESVKFQGRSISLEELFVNQTMSDYDNIFNSVLLEKMIKGEKIKVGLPLSGLREDTAHFYVNRQFQKRAKGAENLKNAKIVIPEEKIFEIGEKLILISDVAGMGKTTTIANLASTIKQTNPNLWIVQIELNDFTTVLKSSVEENLTTIDVIDLLNSKKDSQFENQLEKYVFTLKEKVVFMLDGIDEISPDYTKLILNMLSGCLKETNFAKIFVTTRPHVSKELEKRLNTDSFEMQPLSNNDQIKFLARYWAHHLTLKEGDKTRCENYAEALINKMSTWMKNYYHIENNFPGVPLQARMLAEIFQENNQSITSTNWDGCKEYITKEWAEPKLPEQMNVVEMYEMFIKKKGKVFMDKNNPSGNITANQLLADKCRESILDHESLALEVIFGEKDCKIFPRYQKKDDFENNLLKIGIVQKIHNELHFIHRTFAEFFVAKAILNNLGSENVEFQKLLIDKLLLSDEYNMICSFFDGFLQKNGDMLSSHIFQQYYSLKNVFDVAETYNKSNLIFQLAKQGFVKILQLIFKCIDFKIVRQKEISVADHVPKHIKCSNTLKILKHFTSQAGVNITNGEQKTPLHFASQRGHLEMVVFLINHGANIECRDSNGRTPLHLSVYDSHFDVTKYLVEQGANIQSKDKEGRTIPYESITGGEINVSSFLLDNILKKDGLDLNNPTIHYMAAYLGRLDILRLVENRLNVNSLFEGDQTLLSFATIGGQLDTLKYLIRRGANVEAKDGDGNTILHMACLEGQPDIVRFLVVERGLNVNTKNDTAGTALNLAVLSGNIETVKFLVEHGANVHIKDQYDNTVLELAASMNRWDIVKVLVTEAGFNVNVTDSNGSTALHIAVSKSQWDIVDSLIEQGADINHRDNGGRSALHLTSKVGRLDGATKLVKYKININIRDNHGRTALHLAAEEGEVDICEFLVRSGADVDVTDNNLLTALHLAVSSGRLQVVKLLVRLGSDLYIKDGSGCAALHRAVLENQLDMVEFFLVECGMDVNMRNDQNKTPLHLASEFSVLQIVKLLVENGAEIDLTDNGGCSALHVAAYRGHLEVVKFLVQHGGDLHLVDNLGRTMLHLAVLANRISVVEYFVERDVDINAKDKKERTALNIADSFAQFDIVTFLLERGAHFGEGPRS